MLLLELSTSKKYEFEKKCFSCDLWCQQMSVETINDNLYDYFKLGSEMFNPSKLDK